MSDTYRNYGHLSRNEVLNKDYRIQWRKGKTNSAIIAPHGGGIEPGTTEIADALAGKDHSFYTLEGIKSTGNHSLHITSTHFDEPNGVRVVSESMNVLAIHGCSGEQEIVYLGGLDAGLKSRIQGALRQAGFKACKHDNPELQGIHQNNICNRGKNGRGVQLELSVGLRKKMFYGLSTKDRHKTSVIFKDFVAALEKTLSPRTTKPGTREP